jgi:hypothetical protein
MGEGQGEEEAEATLLEGGAGDEEDTEDLSKPGKNSFILGGFFFSKRLV